MTPEPAEGLFHAAVSATIGEAPVAITGRGSFDKALGIVRGNYELKNLPNTVHPYLFNCVLFTGYPSVCATHSGVVSPFARGSYNYEREIDFGQYGRISYRARCQESSVTGERLLLNSTFELTGTASVPELLNSEPIIETWVPAGADRVDAHFTIVWPTADGHWVTGRAQTRYTLPEGAQTPRNIIHRWIGIEASTDGNSCLQIHQRSHIWSGIPPERTLG